MKANRFLLMLLVMLGSVTGAWAETVSYVDADGTVKSVNAEEITSETTSIDGWYVVTGTDVQTGSIKCDGNAHLILADGAKLTITSNSNKAGIVTSGYSLTIYGQSAQTGCLIANGGSQHAGIGGNDFERDCYITINGGIVTANGGNFSAGIGGGLRGSGSDITINGGIVKANGGISAAGIGGGESGLGSNITIKGGIVMASSARNASGIGGGYEGSVSNIYVTPELCVRADGNNPPATVIAHSAITDDISSSLSGKLYVWISALPYFVLRSSDDSKGKVFGVDKDEFFPLNTSLSFCAIPAVGYKFSQWSDGNTENPRHLVLTDDTALTATFEALNIFQDPTGTGMRMKVTTKSNKVYEFKTQDVKSVDYYRVNE